MNFLLGSTPIDKKIEVKKVEVKPIMKFTTISSQDNNAPCATGEIQKFNFSGDMYLIYNVGHIKVASTY